MPEPNAASAPLRRINAALDPDVYAAMRLARYRRRDAEGKAMTNSRILNDALRGFLTDEIDQVAQHWEGVR